SGPRRRSTTKAGEPPLRIFCACELGEKVCELQTHRLKGELLQCELLRFNQNYRPRLGVIQQDECDSRDFATPTAFAASFWEHDSFNRAIAAYADIPC